MPWWLWTIIIIQGIIIYFILGIITYIIFNKLSGLDWRKEWTYNSEDDFGILCWWPFFLVIELIILPVYVIKKVMDSLSDTEK